MRYVLEPEVAGEIGPESNVDYSVHPPKVRSLEYVFSGWLGDGIVESFPCYLVTRALGDELKRGDFSGFELADVDIARDEQFDEFYPEEASRLPDWYWLRVTGEGDADMRLESDNRMSVSTEVLEVIRRHGAEHCDVEDLR